jgi:hypothetical protein
MPQTPEELDAEIEAHIAGLKAETAEINAQVAEIEAEERQRRFRTIIEPIMGCSGYLVFAAMPIVLLIAFVKSIAWVVETLLPILAWVGTIGLLLVPVFLLLAIPRITRAWAGLGITLSSYVIGIGIWVWSLVIAYAMAGVFWIAVGLFFAGVGVVAVAAIASALHGEWFVFIQIVVGVVVVYALRLLGAYLIEKAAPKEEDYSEPPLPPDFDDEDIVGES